MAGEPKLRTGAYLVFDFETGGLFKKQNPSKNQIDPLGYPITDFACIALKGNDLSEIIRYDDLILPYDDTLTYDPTAAKITGITKDLLEKEGISLEEFGENLKVIFDEANQFSSMNQKAVLVGHNIRFDIPFLQDVAGRLNIDLSKYLDGDWNPQGQFCPRYLDTEKLGLMLWGANTNIRGYNLGDSCERAGIDIIGAHRAMPDVKANTELFRYFVNKMRGIGDEDTSLNTGNRGRTSFQF